MFFSHTRLLVPLFSFASVIPLTNALANPLGSTLPKIQVGDYRATTGGGRTLHVGWVTGFGPYVSFGGPQSFSLDVHNDRRMLLFFEFDCALRLRLEPETPDLLEVVQVGSCSQQGFEAGEQVSGPYLRVR